MIMTESFAELGEPTSLQPAGVYYDEVELSDRQGHGLSRKAHVEELARRAEKVLVVGARFEFRAGRAHPDYGMIIASVTGDRYTGSLGYTMFPGDRERETVEEFVDRVSQMPKAFRHD